LSPEREREWGVKKRCVSIVRRKENKIKEREKWGCHGKREGEREREREGERERKRKKRKKRKEVR
jgi:hypothetical protein